MQCALSLVIAAQLFCGNLSAAANPLVAENNSHAQPQGSHDLRNEQYGLLISEV